MLIFNILDLFHNFATQTYENHSIITILCRNYIILLLE